MLLLLLVEIVLVLLLLKITINVIINYYESTCHSENPWPFHILLDQLGFSLTFNFLLNK